jgi:hypothetical protein
VNRVTAMGLGLALLAGAPGCRVGKGPVTPGPRLEVRWTGGEAATFRAPATADWCDSLNLLEILAMSGDTGIAIAIYPREGIATGSYPVRPAATADSLPPSSAIGLRWFTQTSVRGFQGDSGVLSLTREADGTLSGRFKAAAHPVTGKGPLTLTGSFDGLRERPATRGCSTAPSSPVPPHAPADSESGLD